jgi:hypothetical protein
MSSPKQHKDPKDPTLAMLKRAGVPLSRESYIERAFMLTEDEMDAELEAELPEMFRRTALDEPMLTDKVQ